MNRFLASSSLALAVCLLVSSCSKEPSLREVESEDLVGVAASARFSGSGCYVDQENESVVTLVLGEDRSAHLHLSGFGGTGETETADGTWNQSGSRAEVTLDNASLSVEEVEEGALRVDGLQTLSVRIENSPILHRQHP